MNKFCKKLSFHYETESRYEWYMILNNIHIKCLFLDQIQYEFIFSLMKNLSLNPQILNNDTFNVPTIGYTYHKL